MAGGLHIGICKFLKPKVYIPTEQRTKILSRKFIEEVTGGFNLKD
jgi:hypothetical protein